MEFWLRLSCAIQAFIYFLLRPIFYYIYGDKPPSVPPLKNPLLKLNAATLARKIRKGEITSEAVVEAYIQRIKEVNPFLNAVIEDRFEAALQDAKNCDVALKSGKVTAMKLEKEKPLYGVPFTVKESCGLKGLSQTGCTLVRRNEKATADSLIVESMKNAGAIPLCVTNTPELCTGFNSANLLFGQTNNPYDGRCTSGGSSGGEGALLGAGASLIGIGSDIAGSIRVPGLWNGVFGHKPTPGIIPIKGHYPMSKNARFQNYLVLGPLTRYAEDLHLAVKIMSSECNVDLGLDRPVDINKLKIYYLEDAGKSFGLIETEEEIRNSIKRAAKYFETLGATVKKSPLKSLAETCEIATSLFFGMKDIPQILMDPNDPKHEKKPLPEGLKALFGLSQYTKSTIFVKLLSDVNGLIPEGKMKTYEAAGEKLRQKFLEMLGEDGVFFYPTFPTAAPLNRLVSLRTVGGIYCLLANVFGCPATHVPMGLNRDGLPIGFQVIAAPNNDRLCLAVARELENGFGGWVPPLVS